MKQAKHIADTSPTLGEFITKCKAVLEHYGDAHIAFAVGESQNGGTAVLPIRGIKYAFTPTGDAFHFLITTDDASVEPYGDGGFVFEPKD